MLFKKSTQNTNTNPQDLGGFNPANYQPQPNNGQLHPTGSMPPNQGGVPPQSQVISQPTRGIPPQVTPPPAPKKKSKLPLIIGFILLIVVLGVVALKVKSMVDNANKPEETPEVAYETTGKYALDSLLSALNTYNPETLDSLIGTKDGDSYLAQEWAYVNRVKLREEFITKVGSLVKFEYPNDLMNSGEAVKITHPDYEAIKNNMHTDTEYIKRMLTSSGYKPADYDFSNELTNLMLQYILDKGSIPVKTTDLVIPIRLSVSGTPYIESDADLDDLLFGSDELRGMCTKFSQVCLDWTGFKDEEYVDREEQHNPEYDKWEKVFKKYYKADKGVFNKHTSKWEPFYKRTKKNKYVLDKKGNKVVNYYTIKDKHGKDWIQPDKTIFVKVTKVRQVEDPWVEETGITFNWIGQNYIKNKYTGTGDRYVRVGDGSRENPAGVGTSLITKILCTDGKYHDVRVTLLGYWDKQDGIDYAEKFSIKNRGFSVNSVVQLITAEFRIENLENKAIEFEGSEFTLADKNANISPRTGTLYGFSELTRIEPKQTVVINDWASSTELQFKYFCWGRTFGREFPILYFKVLAGDDKNVAKYSAYEQFTGKSNLEAKPEEQSQPSTGSSQSSQPDNESEDNE